MTAPRVLPLLLALLALPTVLPSAAAASTCGGTWAGPAVCYFSCDGPTLHVKGSGENWGGLASVSIFAECGTFDPTGKFVPLVGVQCANAAPDGAGCASSGPNPLWPLQLAGRCRVNGNVQGFYSCVST